MIQIYVCFIYLNTKRGKLFHSVGTLITEHLHKVSKTHPLSQRYTTLSNDENGKSQYMVIIGNALFQTS